MADGRWGNRIPLLLMGEPYSFVTDARYAREGSGMNKRKGRVGLSCAIRVFGWFKMSSQIPVLLGHVILG